MLVNQKRMAAAVMAFLGLAGSSAFATPVTSYFRGEITRVVDTFDLLLGGIEVGDSFIGRYTFELDTPDSFPADSNFGEYQGALTTMGLRAGDLVFTPTGFGSRIFVGNDQNGDYDFYQMASPLFFENHQLDFVLESFDLGGISLDSDLLLAVPMSLAQSEFARISFGDQVSGVGVNGDLRLLSVVPEPATGVLALIGGMVAILRRR